MAMMDTVGMDVAVELLFQSLNAVPCIKGESHIQFDSMRRPRTTFTPAWESSPLGIQESFLFLKLGQSCYHILPDSTKVVWVDDESS